MPKLLLTRGLPASGKSTWAHAWAALDPESRKRVNRDDTRTYLGLPTGKDEAYVSEVQQTAVRYALRQGIDVVVDDTNLVPRFAKQWLVLAVECGAEVEWHDEFLDVDVMECVRRDMNRDARVGSEVIHRMHQRYVVTKVARKRPELPADEVITTKPYSGTPDKPAAFLVDLDGTIAHNDGHRSFYDYSKVAADKPHQEIIDIVRAVWSINDTLPVFVSGREDSCYGATRQWIVEHVFPQSHYSIQFPLFMRKTGDGRKDSIIKLEIFDQHIRDNYDVKFCLDDRKQVVDAYRSIGLRVLQVAPGNF